MPTARIPVKVLKRAAEALLPGPDVSRHEQRHGKKTKLTVLRELMKADPAFRKRVRAFVVEDRTAESKAYARGMGWLDDKNEPPTPTDNGKRDRGMWDVYRLGAQFDLETLGQPAPGMPTKWHTADGDIDLLTAEEKAFALYRFNERKAGRLPDWRPAPPEPPYVPSIIDWSEIDYAVRAEDHSEGGRR